MNNEDRKLQGKRSPEDLPEDAPPNLKKRWVPNAIPDFDQAYYDGKRFQAEVNNVFQGEHAQEDVPGVEMKLPLPALKLAQYERFGKSIHGGNIHCIRRSAYDTLYNSLNSNSFSYLHGPIGMGKSFFLFYLYCRLSATPNTRVLYINNCASLCIPFGDQYLFKSAVVAFWNDPDALDRIIQLAIYGHWSQMLEYLQSYCATKHLSLWAIFDQHNKIPIQDRKNNKMLDMLFLSSLLQPCKFVVSASANNEDQELRDVDTVLFASGFTAEEFKTWCKSRCFFLPPSTVNPQINIIEDVNPNPQQSITSLDDVVTLVESVTGLIPRELDILDQLKRTHPTFSLEALVRTYTSNRVKSMDLDLINFIQTKVDAETKKDYLKTCQSFLAKLPTTSTPIFDKRIMFTENVVVNNEEVQYIRPVLPLVQEVVLKRIETADFRHWIGDFLQTVQFPNDAKGRVIELYLIHTIQTNRSCNLPTRKIKLNAKGGILRSNQDNPIWDLIVNNLHIEYLIGKKAPPSKPSDNTLYIPRDPNYGDVDFFIWDQAIHKLYVFQVTMLEDPTRHSHTWFASNPSFDAWKLLLAPSVEDDSVWQQKVWITRAPPATNKFKDHLFTNIFDDDFQQKLQSGPFHQVLKFVPYQSP